MNKFIKELPRALFISFSIFVVLLIIRFLSGQEVTLNNFLKLFFLYTMLYGLTLYYANAIVFMGLDHVFKIERFVPKRLLIGFVASFIISIFTVYLLRVFRRPFFLFTQSFMK